MTYQRRYTDLDADPADVVKEYFLDRDAAKGVYPKRFVMKRALVGYDEALNMIHEYRHRGMVVRVVSEACAFVVMSDD